MNYQKLKESLSREIELHRENKKAQSHYRHMLTGLNNLERYNLVDTSNIKFYLTDGLPGVLSEYREALKLEGKSDTRGPLSRIRRLSEYYNDISATSIDFESLTLSEVLKAASKRKYGNKLYEKRVAMEDRQHVANNYITYNQICFQIVESSAKKKPGLWPKVDLSISKTIYNYAGNMRNWFFGDTYPTIKTPNERFYFIEDFLDLPRGILLEKIRETSNITTNENIDTKRKSVKPRKLMTVNVLNENFQKFYDEFCEYKINDIQPTIRNITDEMKAAKSYMERLRVMHLSKGVETNWTFSANGNCPSASRFYNTLKAFINYCVCHENIDEKDVNLFHLTNIGILERLVIATKAKKNKRGSLASSNIDNQRKIGGSTVVDILKVVSAGAAIKGYLRLCGEPGERNLSDYFSDLDYLTELTPTLIKNAKRSIQTKGKGSSQGKENITFLLDLEAKERKRIGKGATQFLMKKCDANLRIAMKLVEKAKLKGNETLLKKAFTNIRMAYSESLTALIYSVSFIICPRVLNWSLLKFYDDSSLRDNRFSSLSYNKQKKRYNLYIPVFGPDVFSEFYDEDVRYIKNSASYNIEKTDVDLGEHLTPIIDAYRKCRDIFIHIDMPYQVSFLIEQNRENINKLNDGFVKGLSDKTKEILIIELEKDIAAFQSFKTENIDALFPWIARRSLPLKTSKYHDGEVNNDEWYIIRNTGRNFHSWKNNIADKFKGSTKLAFSGINEGLEQVGINIHAMRHLVVITYLELNPGDFIGAAAIINDEVSQIFQRYGDKNRGKAMKRLSNME
ncbi:MAG: hypothetical protein ACJAUY_001637 [Cognaticolwellia sp.]|jgi:hypothetical protein